MQTLKQRFFTDLKQNQNVKFLYQVNVKKQIGYKYQRQLLRTNQYFIVDIFSRGKSCFVKLKIVSVAERIKRQRTHQFSDTAHISPRISITLHWTLISTLFSFEERFEVLFFHNQKKGKSYRGQISTIDYNRYRSVKRVSESTFFSRSVVFPRFYMLVTCLTGLIWV